MHDPRLPLIEQFAARHLGCARPQIEPASDDASFRRYFRVRVDANAPPMIVMDAPPEREDCRPFVSIAGRLRRAGLPVPQIYAQDLEQGLLLLEDLGHVDLLSVLDADNVDAHCEDAMALLIALHQRVPTAELPHYDRQRLVSEMELFPTWFLERHLGFCVDCDSHDRIEHLQLHLVLAAEAQPQCFVHRDFHSRNLMMTANGPVMLDFQDALLGPMTYDLVSVLKDCYMRWPRAQVLGWAEQYRQRAKALGLTDADRDLWRSWFDCMGMQRHLKVLGIFARLWYRDGKSRYLADLPRVYEYLQEACADHPESADFGRWLRSRIDPAQLAQAR